MKKILIFGCLMTFASLGFTQKASDLFVKGDVKISWLGIDFSHVKLIGDFSQFSGAGLKNYSEIKNTYFPAWNKLILNESKKYDIKGMLRKDDIYIDIDMIMDKNSKTSLDSLESYNEIKFTEDVIKKFVSEYNVDGKTGIGIVFIAENLNKTQNSASFYFIAIGLANKEVLISERFTEEPRGIGIRNFWAGAIYKMIKEINSVSYSRWKTKYQNN